MPGQLALRHVSVSLAGRRLLDDVSLTIGPGSRVGLLGPNGVGKTTLLRTCAGLIAADGGSIVRSPMDATVGYLEQEPADRDDTLLAMIRRRTGVHAAQREAERLGRTMGEDLELIQRYTDAITREATLGAHDVEARAGRAVAELGLPDDALHQPVSTLSGGQRARAELAALTLVRFDVLLLDEPTNDLDLDGLDVLERFVQTFPGGIVVVSHDRAFLDRCVDRFLELDPFTHEATPFTGSWREYERQRELRRERKREEHERTSAERARLLAQAREVQNQAAHGVAKVKKSGEPSKAVRFAKTQRAEARGAKAVTIRARAERIEVAEKPREPWSLRIDLMPKELGGEHIAALAGAVVQRGAFQLGPIDLDVRRAERIAVLGPNGSGKSTLLEALIGEMPLTSGTRTVGTSTVFGLIRQERKQFDGSTSLEQRFAELTDLRGAEARTLLAKFDLTAEDVARPCRELSPGERTRASLAALMARRVNCLVLDEPTNHLDIPAIEELERSLTTYTGTFLLATHDRRLLERVGITRTVTMPQGTAGVVRQP